MVSSALLLWFILPFALAQPEHQQQQSQEADQPSLALYSLSFIASFFFFFFLSFLCIRWRRSRRAPEANQTSLALLYFLAFTASFFFFLFLSVLFRRWRRSRRAVIRVDDNILLHDVQSVNSRPSPGIDENLIKSLPLFQFSTLGCSSDGPVECVICLSKFESTDVVRVLPQCNDAFHAQCIDQWLQQHSNCPLCRQTVEVQDISSTHLHETQSSAMMEEGTTERPNGDSLNRHHSGTTTVRDNRDVQTPV